MVNISKNKIKKDSIDRLKESYNLLVEIMENSQKVGWVTVLTKVVSGSKRPINIRLFDFKNKIVSEIENLTNFILRKIDINNFTGGSKKIAN